MNTRTCLVSALLGCAILSVGRLQADTFVTITPTAATSATVAPEWGIGAQQTGLGYIGGNSGFPGATATNFFTISGATVPLAGSPAGFTSYLPAGTPSPQASVGNSLTPNSYSGLTYVADNLGLIGPLSFYTIHHAAAGDYLALIQPSTPTVSDQKPMSGPGGPTTPGATGYFALSYAADSPGGWGAELFYYFRTDSLGNTIFGSMVPALSLGPTDRWNLGTARGYTDLAYTSTDLGLGFGAGQFYYLRLDPVTQTTFFGHLDPVTGIATDIQNLGAVYRTLTFTPTNVGYGANNFYSIQQAAVAQTITFGALPGHTACDAPFTVAATASSGLAVNYTVTGPATLSAGNLLTLTGATGTVAVTAAQAGDAGFSAAAAVTQSFNVSACAGTILTSQTIVFAALPGHTACDAPFTVAATASSGLAVTFTVTGPATLSAGNLLTLTGATGAVAVTAAQAGNASYSAATNVVQSFNVSACTGTILAPQTIVFPAIPAHTACDAPFTVAATASSGLGVTFTVSGPATLSAGNLLTLTGATGTVVVTAAQAGNASFGAAVVAVQSFAVSACVVAPPSSQTISFPALSNHLTTDAPFSFVAPTASSGLPIALSISGPATLSAGNTITLTGAAGTVALVAAQAGNGSYLAATSVTQTFLVSSPASVPVVTSQQDIQPYQLVNLTQFGVGANDVGGTVGIPLTYQITSTATATGYAALLLPAGLSLNPVTGVISGTPTTANTWFTTVEATNAAGTGTALVIFVIAPAGSPPVVTSQRDIQPDPVNNPSNVGVGANDVAGTVGVPFSYQIVATDSPTSYSASLIPAGLNLNPATGVVSGTPTTANTWFMTVSATNAAGTGSAVVIVVIAAPAVVATPSSRIVNLSTLAQAGPGAQALIMGFVVSGSGKSVLLRGVGPALTGFGLAAVLPDPVLTLSGTGGVLATNEGWQTPSAGQAGGAVLAAAAAQVDAFALPSGSADSAILATLNGGAYTAAVTSQSGRSGLALVEIYDADLVPVARLINFSVLTSLGQTQSLITSGLVITGDAPKTLLIRGVGPSLTAFGVPSVLADPQFVVLAGGATVAPSATWGAGGTQAAQIATVAAQVGAFPLISGGADAAVLITLQPGSYTIQLASAHQMSGTFLLEVYDTQ